MDKTFANIIILLMLGYFNYSRAIFHCFKLFHLTLFMVILGYFCLFLIISSEVTFGYALSYLLLLYVLFVLLGYFTLGLFWLL
jgi:hypothetical protein